jgi:hypothetical protein
MMHVFVREVGRTRRPILCVAASVALMLLCAGRAQAQSAGTGWVFDAGIGIDSPINGNVNSGAIGFIGTDAAAILPNSYGDVYGTGIQFRFGGGYMLNDLTEVRGVFIFQSADADLVRLGDVGSSSLYGKYSDYQNLSLDFGARRYLELERSRVRPYAEATIGLAFIDAIDVQLAAPQSGLVIDNTDFYDQTAAFTLSVSGGVLVPLTDKVDVTAQIGLRRVSGLAEVDQLVGTGLEEINNDTARLTFPAVVGVRYKF